LKILILKPSSLGDVVHALPVLRLLKLRFPQSEIFWWLDADLVPLLEGDPDLAGIFHFDRRHWNSPRCWWRFWASLRAMREQRFDWAIDLQGLARSGIVAWLANARLNIGLDNPREGRREGARAFYDMLVPASPEGAHAVERYLSVLPALGVPVHGQFDWLPERPQIAAQVRAKCRPNSALWIALVPGARWLDKRWPVEYFVELVKRLSATTTEIKFAILGSAADRELATPIAQAAPARCLALTGQTSLPELIEWIRLTQLVVSNDTGPLHIAAALGKPLIALFGPSDPKGTGPHGQPDAVLQANHLPCVPCLKSSCSYLEPLACLRSITPAMVYEQARQRLTGLARRPMPNLQAASRGCTA
jgi:lipopolysaccharide heptosyltransferase I